MLASRQLLPGRHAYATPYARTSAAAASVVRQLQTAQQEPHNAKTWSMICWLHDQITSLGAGYMFTGAAAAWLQGADMQPQQLQAIQVSIQWDFMHSLHSAVLESLQQHAETQIDVPKEPAIRLQHQQPTCQHVSAVVHMPGGKRAFSIATCSMQAEVTCEVNQVLHMQANRVEVQHAGKQLWCESLLSIRNTNSQADPSLAAAVNKRLQELQTQLTEENAKVWSQADTAAAWENKVGSPAAAAAWLKEDPLLRLGQPLVKHLPQPLTGVKMINLMGSSGTKAVAAALLGAEVTCIDISPANVQYGQQLAKVAGVDVQFVVADVLSLPAEVDAGTYDIVLLELGVLHYFVDLLPLMKVIQQLLRPAGTLLLREFHPVSTKLIASKGKKHKVTGNYFETQLVASEVAYSKYVSGDVPRNKSMMVKLRQWGLGEVVSSVAEAGLVIKRLEEEPGVKSADIGLPKLFTLVACKYQS